MNRVRFVYAGNRTVGLDGKLINNVSNDAKSSIMIFSY